MTALKKELVIPARPTLLIIMDGVGLAPAGPGNAVHLAHTPNLDHLMATRPWLPLKAHGPYVGMPSADDMGNSEVGHNALGAGRIFAQGAKLVDEAIASGRLFTGPVWKKMTANKNGALHFVGLLSDGNVHSHQKHLHALMKQAANEGIKKIFIHVLLDGRDVSPRSAETYIQALEEVCQQLSTQGCEARIASGGGRQTITMDRYQADWEMVHQGYRTHVQGHGRGFGNALEALDTLRHESGSIDQDLPAFVITEQGEAIGKVQDHDSMIFFNFRGDRAIEFCQAMEAQNFPHFKRDNHPQIQFAGMMEYDGDTHVPQQYLVDPPAIDHTISESLAASGVKQWACSETQKYGHVTYFWNGNRSGAFDDKLEDYLEIPSDKISFSLAPQMKAQEITNACLEVLKAGQHPFMRLNLANGDMVGHTGSLNAAIEAVSWVDQSVGQLVKTAEACGARAIITADHGNADEMLQFDRKKGQLKEDEQGQNMVSTSHSLNEVPLIWLDPDGNTLNPEIQDASLAHVGNTILQSLGFSQREDCLPSLLKK